MIICANRAHEETKTKKNSVHDSNSVSASNIASYPPTCAPSYAGNQTNSLRLRFAVEPGLTTWKINSP